MKEALVVREQVVLHVPHLVAGASYWSPLWYRACLKTEPGVTECKAFGVKYGGFPVCLQEEHIQKVQM